MELTVNETGKHNYKWEVAEVEPLSERLKEIGIDIASPISRLGGNESLYLSICRSFLLDTNYDLARKAFLNKDFATLKIHVHTLKGVAANLGFTTLSSICKNLLDNMISIHIPEVPKNMERLEPDVPKIMERLEPDVPKNMERLEIEYNRIINILTEAQ